MTCSSGLLESVTCQFMSATIFTTQAHFIKYFPYVRGSIGEFSNLFLELEESAAVLSQSEEVYN